MFDKFLRSLYGCATQLILQIGNRQVCIIFHIPGDERKGLLEYGASLCHRNSKKLVDKSCRKFTFLLKSQNSPEIQATQKKTCGPQRKRHFRFVYSPRKVKNNYYLARLSKWIIHLTNLDWKGNCRKKVYLVKY